MKATVYTVNATGLREIADFLGENFKQAVESGEGADYFSDEMLAAWASYVEESLEAGNGAQFEVHGIHSVSGNPIIGRISAAGLDACEIEIEA